MALGVNENAQELYPHFEDVGDEHRPDLFDVIGDLLVIESVKGSSLLLPHRKLRVSFPGIPNLQDFD